LSNRSFYLFQLQKIDRRKDQINTRMTQIQALIGDQQAFSAASASYNGALSALQDLGDRFTALEKKNTEKRLKMEISEASLYGGAVKNPKELTDLQTEIASLKSFLKSLENDQLELMILMEDQQLKTDQAQKTLETIIASQESSHKQLIEENQLLLNELERLKLERSAIEQQLSPESIALYDALRKSKKGNAVAGVEDQCCSICGSQLTAADVQHAKSSSQIVFCPSCGRILYAD